MLKVVCVHIFEFTWETFLAENLPNFCWLIFALGLLLSQPIHDKTARMFIQDCTKFVDLLV